MAVLPEFFPGITGFQWDEGNSEKSWLQHQVTQAEAEQVFFNRPVVALAAAGPVAKQRFFALGRTDSARELAIVFTIRGKLARVISARPMSRRERRVYAQAKPSED